MKYSVALFCVALSSCTHSPDEPTPAKAKPAGDVASAAAPSNGAPTTAVTPPGPKDLEWTTPPGWTTEKVADAGSYRAKYTVPPLGDDKEGADVLVRYLGRLAQPELESSLTDWTKDFDGNALEHATRAELKVGAITVQVVEVEGTYKLGMGPPIDRKKQKFAAYVVKQGWRGIGAIADSAERGVWFFRMVGPDNTVQSARSAMREMLRSLH